MNTLMLTMLAVCFLPAMARESSYSHYCNILDEPVLTGYFTDGFYCGGSFRVSDLRYPSLHHENLWIEPHEMMELVPPGMYAVVAIGESGENASMRLVKF